MKGVAGLASCGLTWQILCNPSTSPVALFTVHRLKLLWTQTRPVRLLCKLHPTTPTAGPPLWFTRFLFKRTAEDVYPPTSLF